MERNRGSNNNRMSNKERRAQWEELDGVDLSNVPTRWLGELMKVIKEPRGEYGAEHEDALARAHEMIRGTNLSRADQAALIVSATKDIVGRLNRTPEADEAYYNVRHEVLPQVLGVTFFVKAGKELGAALEEDGRVERNSIAGISDRDTDRFPTLTSVAPAVASQVLKRLNEYDLTQYNYDTEDLEEGVAIDMLQDDEKDARTYVTIGAKKKADHFLETGLVETARMMSKFYVTSSKKFSSVDDIVAQLEQHDAESRIDTVKLRTNADNLRVLPINELRLGHQDGKEGILLVQRTVELIKNLPAEKRPQVITVTNLIQSDFEHSQSQKRQALGLKEISEQFDAANKILDLLRELGIPVIVSLGEDDHRMAKDAALNIVNEMNGIVKEGGKENFIPYYGINKTLQDKQFQVHKLFYLQNILPLTYRMGRPLRDKDAVGRDTGDDLNYSEYFALYNHIAHGAELPEGLGIDPEVIVKMGEFKDGLCFVDDFNLVAETEGTTRDIAYRHVTQFTSESLKQNHMTQILKLLGSLAAKNGVSELADLVISGQQQEHYSIANKAVSLPGLWDTEQSMNRKQYYSSAPGDSSRRANFIKSVPGTPGVSMIEMTDDGRFIQSFINKEFMDKADSLPRTAIFEFCDTQIGSVSARPDIQIEYLSYMLETARDMPIAIYVTGDMVHGHIYPTFPEESQSVGLIGLKSQKEMMKGILTSVFDVSDPIIRNLVESVIEVGVQPGNHDKIMRPRFPNNLDDNIDYLIHEFQNIVGKDRVRHDAVFNQGGTPVGTWMQRTHLGAYSMLSAHYHLEKKGMAGGGAPVADAYRRVQGLGEKAPNILLGAHWHNPQTAMFGNTLSVIGGPMAGQTEFEDFRGMKATPFGTVIKIGGGEPVAVESISAATLRLRGGAKLEKTTSGGKKYEVSGVKYGQFTPDKLAEQGLYDDDGFNPAKHGPYLHDDYPKSAAQKAILKLQRAASHLAAYEGETENPNRYENGQPVHLNELTRRAYEIAAQKQQRA